MEPISELESFLVGLPDELRACCRHVLDEPRFATAPASADKHHAYEGGLAVHTLEVVRQAFVMASSQDEDIVIAAAIWHDYGKIYETTQCKGGNYVKTLYRHLIRHVAGSYAAFVAAASATGVSPELQESIGHCILAHHGRHEWGSPVEPQTEAAYVLHAADMWSARYGPGKAAHP